MTPAINTAKKAKINFNIHEYEHDSSAESYGMEAAEKIGVPAQQVFKTLVICLDNKNFAVGLVPVSSMLNMKAFAKASRAKKAVMADSHDVQRLTGYVLGGVSPLGQKKKLKTVIDSSAENLPSIFVSAGRRGLEIELSVAALTKLTNAIIAEISQL